MMKKNLLATILGFVATAGREYSSCPGNNRQQVGNIKDRDQQKQRLMKLFADNSRECQFVIHGEPIMAKSRKDALRIYANRHPEALKKGKRK